MPECDEPFDVVIGKIVEAHGMRGWVKVLPLTDSVTRLGEVHPIRLARSSGELVAAAIDEARASGRHALVKFVGVEGRDAAEALVGATINIKASMRQALPEGEYYVDEILGLRVETADGADLGTITEVRETGANDVYVTPAALIPAIADAIEEIDLQRGVVRVRRSAVVVNKQE